MIEEYLEDYYGENKRKPQKRQKSKNKRKKQCQPLSEEQIDEIYFWGHQRGKKKVNKNYEILESIMLQDFDL